MQTLRNARFDLDLTCFMDTKSKEYLTFWKYMETYWNLIKVLKVADNKNK